MKNIFIDSKRTFGERLLFIGSTAKFEYAENSRGEKVKTKTIEGYTYNLASIEQNGENIAVYVAGELKEGVPPTFPTKPTLSQFMGLR